MIPNEHFLYSPTNSIYLKSSDEKDVLGILEITHQIH